MNKCYLKGIVAALSLQCSSFAAETITVDLNDNQGTVKGTLLGLLNPFSNDAAEPAVAQNSEFYDPLKVKFIRTGTNNAAAYTARVPNAEYVTTISRNLATPPWESGRWVDYENEVSREVLEMIALGLDPIYDVMNEPPKNGEFFEAFKRAYDIIRELHPEAKITGPSYTPGASCDEQCFRDALDAFRAYCIANDCLPDVWNFHFGAAWSDDVVNHIREWDDGRPIMVLEYLRSRYVRQPGAQAWKFAQMENETDLYGACRAQWSSNGDTRGTLSGLLLNDNGVYKKQGVWWGYKFYADMEGMTRVATTATHLDLGALAGVDNGSGVMRLLLGNNRRLAPNVGGYRGLVDLELNGIVPTSGNTVQVKITRIPYDDDGAVASLPAPTIDQSFTVQNNQLVVPFDWSNSLDAYQVEITGAMQLLSDGGVLLVEAESASAQSAFDPFTVKYDALASQVSYITTPPGTGNSAGAKATYTFCTAQEMDLTVKILASTTSSPQGDNSFFITLNGGPRETWNFGTSSLWTWYSRNYASVPAGVHTLTIEQREDGANLDKLEISGSAVALLAGDSIEIEAEEALNDWQPEVGNYELFNDATASSDYYINDVDGGNKGGEAFYCFTTEGTTDLTIEVRTRITQAPQGDNSVFMDFDGTGDQSVGTTTSSNWAWKTWKTLRAVPAGEHRVTVKVREEGTQVDKIRIQVN